MTKTTLVQTLKDDTIKELINSIEEIETYSDALINKTSGHDKRKIFVLGIFAASIQYASAVRRLNINRPSAKVSNVFLRSLFEAWGNLEYITLRGDDRFVLEDLKESYKLWKKNQEYKEDFFSDHNVNRIGSLNLSQVRANITKAQKIIDSLQESIDALGINNGIKYKKDLYERFKAVDAANTPKGLEFATYFSYLTLYNHLSADIHLGAEGAMRWIDIDGKTIRANYSGEGTEDVKLVLWTALALVFDITIITMKEFGFYDQEFDYKYQEIINRTR